MVESAPWLGQANLLKITNESWHTSVLHYVAYQDQV